MKVIGPIGNASTIRKEGKYQEGKETSRTSLSRKNINHTVAVRHQLKQNFRFFLKNYDQSEFSKRPHSSETFDIPSTMLTSDFTIKNIKLLKWIKRNELFIKKGTIIILFEPDGPRFYEVQFCCYCQQSGKILIATKQLNNVHFDAFQIVNNDNSDWNIFTTSEIRVGLAIITYKVKLINNNFYIPKKYM